MRGVHLHIEYNVTIHIGRALVNARMLISRGQQQVWTAQIIGTSFVKLKQSVLFQCILQRFNSTACMIQKSGIRHCYIVFE